MFRLDLGGALEAGDELIHAVHCKIFPYRGHLQLIAVSWIFLPGSRSPQGKYSVGTEMAPNFSS
jgi:hypothetical protein